MEFRESVIFVTGASSGIGNACATFLAKKGAKVYGTCRNPATYSRKADEFFELLPMDLSDAASIDKAAETLISNEGHLDALICCAGSGLMGAIEDVDLEEAQALMNVNFFGTLRTIKAFLPKMREAGKGRIVLVGAIEGLAATPFQGIYSAAEFALEGMAQALRIETRRFGVEVGLIELASFRTGFGEGRRMAVAASEHSPYRPALESVLGIIERDEVEGYDPLAAARVVYAMLTARKMPLRRTAGRLMRRILAHSRRWLTTRGLDRRLHRYYRLE